MLNKNSRDSAIEPQRFPCLASSRLVGDPIDVVTGANTDITIDFRLGGPLPLVWRRYYSSARNTVACPLGWGQTHDFDRTLTYDLDGLHCTDPLGADVGFPPLAVGARAANAGLLLYRLTANTFELAQAGKPVQEFEFSESSDTAHLCRLRERAAEIYFRFGAEGHLCEIIDSFGRAIAVESDSHGRILGLFLTERSARSRRRALMVYEYNAAGNMISGRDLYDSTLHFRWDQHNRMTCRTDRRGYSFHFAYDDEGRCIHSRGDDGLLEVFLDYEPHVKSTFVRRGDGGRWIYTYNDDNTITQIIDPYGNSTKFMLDERGRPVQEIDPNDNVTTLHYDWQGGHDYRINSSGTVLPTKEAHPNPANPLAYQLPTTALEWDFGRMVDAKAIQPPRTNDPILAQFPAVVANAVLGKPLYDGTAISNPSPSRTEGLLYTDDFGRPLEHTGPRFTERWKYDANGNLIEHHDRDGSIYRYVYKSWNALTQSIDPLGNNTYFDLTVQGLMAKVTDPGGTVTEYGYDLREQLVEVRENGLLVESYRRDPAGNIIEKTGASGRTLIAWEVGPGNLDKVQTLGSGEKHVFEHDTNGRIIKAQSPAGTATFAYDDEGNLLADQRDGKGVIHEFEFKRLVATTYFNNFNIACRTPSNGELVIQDPTGAQHRFRVGNTGVIAKLLANGSHELCAFNANGRCLSKAVVRTAQDSPPWMHRYEYSAGGDLLFFADNRRGKTQYRYDASHRLAEEALPDGTPHLFEFDGAGNLVRQPGLTNVVIAQGNRLKEANGEVFTYNDRCNLCERRTPSGTIRYEYDDLDMLVRCDIGGEVWTASYDGLCRRVQKTWQGETTRYYWDDFRLAAELRQNGSCRLYIYADESAMAPFLFIEYESLDAKPESGKRYYVFTNQIAAPIHVEDDAGRTVWSARIHPYGGAQVDPASTIDMPLRFPGHYLDRETGLHYNRFRYFSPELGRYLESDPAGLAGGINAYAYPERPLTLVDINGLGKKSGARPKSKNPPTPQVGCHEKLDPEMTPEQVRAELEKKVTKLREDMEAAAKAGHTHVEAPDGSILRVKPSMGPCLSAVYDKETGKVYYGQNTGERPTNLREPLQTNANEAARENYLKLGMMEGYPQKGNTITQPYGSDPRYGIPGSHAEVQAMDKAMRDRDQQRREDPNVPPPQTKDMVIYNQNTTGESQDRGAGKPCCPNCKRITGAERPGDNEPGKNKGPVDVS